MFARSGSGAGASWAQQGAKLAGAGEAGRGYFGDAVALSADGDTALVGGVRDGEQRGAAWVFARSGSGAGASWAQQGEKLTGGEEESGKGRIRLERGAFSRWRHCARRWHRRQRLGGRGMGVRR